MKTIDLNKMEQNNQTFEFKAVTEKQLAFLMLLIAPFTGVFFYIFNFRINIKTVRLPFFCSIGSILFIDFFIMKKIYKIKITDNNISLNTTKSEIFKMSLDCLKEISFTYSQNMDTGNNGSLKFYFENKKIVLIIGYFKSSEKEFFLYKNEIDNFLKNLENKGYVLTEKKTDKNITKNLTNINIIK